MLLGWRPRQKSAPGRRKRLNRQGEVSRAGTHGNTTYGALLAFRSMNVPTSLPLRSRTGPVESASELAQGLSDHLTGPAAFMAARERVRELFGELFEERGATP
jgi:hypothetical protein